MTSKKLMTTEGQVQMPSVVDGCDSDIKAFFFVPVTLSI